MHATWPPGTTILVVEDEILTARLLKARLELEDLRVLEAANGLEALEILAREHVDLVTTDLMMPALDGYRLIREIRSLDGPHARVPLLVLSINQDEDEMLRCLSAGADDYLTKPFSPRLFLQKIQRLLARSTSPRTP